MTVKSRYLALLVGGVVLLSGCDPVEITEVRLVPDVTISPNWAGFAVNTTRTTGTPGNWAAFSRVAGRWVMPAVDRTSPGVSHNENGVLADGGVRIGDLGAVLGADVDEVGLRAGNEMADALDLDV
jgi:hypothetical protein